MPAATRLSVSFDQKSAERLDRLSGDDQGKADVIRDALELEDVFREVTQGGGRLIAQRADGSVAEILRPSGPWGSTGGKVPNAVGGYMLPPGSNGDRDRRELLARVLSVLYSCVGSAQQAEVQEDGVEHAVQQMVLANAALAAGETDAFLTLISASVEGPACVHLRALGELAIRIILCREHRNLALDLYRSWGISWKRLAERHTPLAVSPALDSGEREMQALERSPKFVAIKKDIAERDHLLNETEWAMWSKRVHGDIYALVQVSTNLANRGDDVRGPIIREVPYGLMGNVLLSRATGFALVVVKHMIDTFKIDVPNSILHDCLDAYATIQARDTLAQAAHRTVGNVVLDTYKARIGGSAEDPILCDHNHSSPESAAATCLRDRTGDVREFRRGAFTGAWWTYEAKARSDGKRYYRQHFEPTRENG